MHWYISNQYLWKNRHQPPPWPKSSSWIAFRLGHVNPWEDGHHLHDLGHQRGSCCGGSVYIPFAKSCSSSSLKSYCLWTSSMYMQHGHGHAEWAWNLTWTWTYSMDMKMQPGYGHAAWTWACSMKMGMQYGHGHAAWTWTCTMDMVMLLGNHHSLVLLLIACQRTFPSTFSDLLANGPPMVVALAFFSKLISSDIWEPVFFLWGWYSKGGRVKFSDSNDNILKHYSIFSKRATIPLAPCTVLFFMYKKRLKNL